MADAKITDLAAETAPARADLVAIVDDVAGTPTTKKATLGDVMNLGGLVLIEKKLITSDQTDVTFSGLDGDTDEVYLLQGRFVVPSGGSVPSFTWQPNGLTTNQTSQRTYSVSSSGASDAYTNLNLVSDVSVGSTATFEIKIHAKKNPNGVAADRQYSGTFTFRLTTNTVTSGGTIVGHWAETSTNITSIVINSSVASKIGNGSTFALYKYAQQ